MRGIDSEIAGSGRRPACRGPIPGDRPIRVANRAVKSIGDNLNTAELASELARLRPEAQASRARRRTQWRQTRRGTQHQYLAVACRSLWQRSREHNQGRFLGTQTRRCAL